MQNNILLVTSIYPPQIGGPAVFTSRFALWLKKNDVDFHVLSYTNLNSLNTEYLSFVNYKRNRVFAYIRFVLKIIKLSKRDTIILANGAFTETFLASKLTGRKYILKIPGDHVWERSINKGWTKSDIQRFQTEPLNFRQYCFRKLNNLSLEKASKIIAPTEQLATISVGWGVKVENIEIIYNCVDPKVFIEMGAKNKDFDLITVCRLVPWKGLEELILTAINLELRLAIIGDGPILNSLKKIAYQKNSKVIFLGAMSNENVSEYLNKSKIFVLNSNYEATSYALIEAKMCGLPTVARSTGGSSILIRPNIDGVIYPTQLNPSLSSAILELLGNEALLAKYGMEARKDAIQRFNEDINFEKIFNILIK